MTKEHMETRKTLVCLLGLCILWCIFFYRILFFGENLYCCDNFLINIPAKIFFTTQLKLGHFALWNPYLFRGFRFWRT